MLGWRQEWSQPLYRWEFWGPQRLRKLPKVMHWVNERTRFQPMSLEYQSQLYWVKILDSKIQPLYTDLGFWKSCLKPAESQYLHLPNKSMYSIPAIAASTQRWFSIWITYALRIIWSLVLPLEITTQVSRLFLNIYVVIMTTGLIRIAEIWSCSKVSWGREINQNKSLAQF